MSKTNWRESPYSTDYLSKFATDDAMWHADEESEEIQEAKRILVKYLIQQAKKTFTPVQAKVFHYYIEEWPTYRMQAIADILNIKIESVWCAINGYYNPKYKTRYGGILNKFKRILREDETAQRYYNNLQELLMESRGELDE